MGASNTSKSRTAHSEINVTPLVDVMLVLLIIFMVTAPMMKQGFQVDLPETEGNGIQVSQEPFILTIKKNHKIFFEDKRIPIKTLSTQLTEMLKNRKEKAVYIHADKAVRYGLLAEVISMAKKSGASQISFVTIPKSL